MGVFCRELYAIEMNAYIFMQNYRKIFSCIPALIILVLVLLFTGCAVPNNPDTTDTVNEYIPISELVQVDSLNSNDVNSARGFYFKPFVPLWPNGAVNYEWDSNMRDMLKKATRKAMDEWQNKTGKVKFKEYDWNAWNTL